MSFVHVHVSIFLRKLSSQKEPTVHLLKCKQMSMKNISTFLTNQKNKEEKLSYNLKGKPLILHGVSGIGRVL